MSTQGQSWEEIDMDFMDGKFGFLDNAAHRQPTSASAGDAVPRFSI